MKQVIQFRQATATGSASQAESNKFIIETASIFSSRLFFVRHNSHQINKI